jgi:hypothetical protein
MIVAGFDEAGYGPKLGPLTVACTAFEVEGAELGDEVDLWDLLGDAVRRTGKGDKSKVWVADSKAIKPRKDGLKNLEFGVLAFRESQPKTLPELLLALGQSTAGYRNIPWYQDLDEVAVPAYGWAGEVATRAEKIRAASKKAGVRYLGAGVRVLDAAHYNERIEATQNKGKVLGETCVGLLRNLREQTRGPLVATFDKHGGRSRYLRLLGAALPMCKLDVLAEGPALSAYSAETPQGPVRAIFCTGGEEHSLPVALASMHCKYLRELFMDQFNAWFQEKMPGLKKTAGYAMDAKRFLQDIRGELPKWGVPLDTLVRTR